MTSPPEIGAPWFLAAEGSPPSHGTGRVAEGLELGIHDLLDRAPGPFAAAVVVHGAADRIDVENPGRLGRADDPARAQEEGGEQGDDGAMTLRFFHADLPTA